MFEKRPARRHSCSFLFFCFCDLHKNSCWCWVDNVFFFFEMLTIKYDRMALVNIEKLQTLTMQRWLQLFVCRSCTSTYWPGMPFLRLSYWRSHQIPTTRDLKKVPLCFLFLHVLDFALTISFRKSWVRLFYWKLALHYVKWQLHLSTLHHKTYRESN